MGKLEGKVVIVTGASRGIGQWVAKLFAAEGGKVVCTARTLREGDHQFEGSLETTVGEIREAGGEAMAVAANIANPEECESVVQQARDAYGPVDVLVNNAALVYYIPIKDFPLNRWMRCWDVNLHAPLILSQLVLNDMIPRRSGSIVNISSGAAGGPGPGPYPGGPAFFGQTSYGCQKAALERLTQGMADELYEYGISVTCVSPSRVVATPGTVYHKLVTGIDDSRGESPEVMARATLLLATEPLDEVTGRVTYSQQILKEFGWITEAQGRGVDPDFPISGFALPLSRKTPVL